MASILKGKVVALKSLQTAIVEVERYFTHPKYKKRVKRSKRYKVHYEKEQLHLGDTVEITQTKPISKDKHYKIKL
jgi:small subunit ribosomal protein S17